jgi:hypothetical protein
MIRFIGVLVVIVLAVLVYQDAKSRNMNALLWGILVLVFNLVAAVIYLLIRKPKAF